MVLEQEIRGEAATADANQRAVSELYRRIRGSRAKLVGSNGDAEDLPASLPDFLARVIGGLSGSSPVTIVHDDAQLTTVEGARMLGVSRQFLVKLLDSGGIPHHMVGTHRRIYVRDLLAYKAGRDSSRRRILDELTRAEASDGLYDLEPPTDGAE